MQIYMTAIAKEIVIVLQVSFILCVIVLILSKVC